MEQQDSAAWHTARARLDRAVETLMAAHKRRNPTVGYDDLVADLDWLRGEVSKAFFGTPAETRRGPHVDS